MRGSGYTGAKLFRPKLYREVGLAHFFFVPNQMEALQNDIQHQLRELDSQLDLVALERPGSEALRIFIDHPGGVDLALCERVTKHLNDLRADYSLEVSSPGPKYSRATQPTEVKETP